MHGAVRVNLRCAVIRVVHDPLLECGPRVMRGAHCQIQIQPAAQFFGLECIKAQCAKWVTPPGQRAIHWSKICK